jgi:hypothetical protein
MFLVSVPQSICDEALTLNSYARRPQAVCPPLSDFYV